MSEAQTPSVKPILYEVTLLPEDDINHNVFVITVQDRGHGRWAVIHNGSCLGADGVWDFGVKEYDRGEAWLDNHRFDLDTALRLASQAAPHVVVNGHTAAEVHARLLAASTQRVELKSEQAIQFGDARLSPHFWARVRQADNGCWLWKLKPAANGYGRYKIRDERYMAHRFVYETVVGPVPSGMQVDHVCHSVDSGCEGGDGCLHRRCVNPAHLEPVTGLVNTLRSIELNRDACCPKGHPYDVLNTGYTGSGSRYCKACAQAQRRERYAAKRAAN